MGIATTENHCFIASRTIFSSPLSSLRVGKVVTIWWCHHGFQGMNCSQYTFVSGFLGEPASLPTSSGLERLVVMSLILTTGEMCICAVGRPEGLGSVSEGESGDPASHGPQVLVRMRRRIWVLTHYKRVYWRQGKREFLKREMGWARETMALEG